ncbi:MAG TPA: hypothetical protein PLZ84_07715 [Clostridia bacterium]|nr:hypothetical protein [Clostridia bacterium]
MAVVNIAGYCNGAVLQNTRLYHVKRLSDVIIEGIAGYYFSCGANTRI